MDTKIVEVIGPPGIGKSAVYQALCRQWKPQLNWIHQEALLRPAQPPVSRFASWLQYQAYQLLGKQRGKTIPLEFGIRFGNDHEELARFYWNHLSNPSFQHNEAPAQQFRSAYFLFADFCRYQAIRENGSSRPCLLDEGFLQKSFLLHDDKQYMQDLISQYVSLVPLPYALVYIDTADKNIISQRLLHRKKVHISHAGKGEAALLAETGKWQYLLQTIVEQVENRKVITCKIDGARPIAENVTSIKAFLAGI